METKRLWQRRIGRTLLAGSIGLLALTSFYVAWLEGAFEPTGIFGIPFTLLERVLAWFNLLVAVALAILAPLSLRPKAGRVVLAAVGLAVLAHGLFIWLEGWGDDLTLLPVMYGLLGLGYWLNRLSNRPLPPRPTDSAEVSPK